MDVFLSWAIDHFQKEWGVITGAPVLALAGIGLAFLLAWFLVGKLHETRHAALESTADSKGAHIDFLESQLDDYKSKLSGATPEQAAQELSGLRNDLTAARAQLDMITQWYLHHRTQRHLTKDQKDKLLVALKEVAARIPDSAQKVSVGAIADPEAQQYAIDILRALHPAGLCLLQQTPHFSWSDSPDERGVMIVVMDEQNPPEIARALHDVFKEVGIDCAYDTSSTGFPGDNCMIGVSHKPEPVIKGEPL
jgi:hypothetical protein